MQALLKGVSQLKKWLNRIAKQLINRGKKEARRLKGKPPKLTSWEIIKLLA